MLVLWMAPSLERPQGRSGWALFTFLIFPHRADPVVTSGSHLRARLFLLRLPTCTAQ